MTVKIDKQADEICTHHSYHHSDNKIQEFSDLLQCKYSLSLEKLEKESASHGLSQDDLNKEEEEKWQVTTDAKFHKN